ncbi:MAG: SUMF1/EgtB/PvdO family nonheme iron enzyme, partial [Flavobacteriaceae bacterium]|nr:SUMF1/EgtB/PvdO family nonheme iron enzyme [Flavobacteriaceae bacterium]
EQPGQGGETPSQPRGIANIQTIEVKGGKFQMGGGTDVPIHNVTLDDFSISKYEITNEEYAKFLNAKATDGQMGKTDEIRWYVGDDIQHKDGKWIVLEADKKNHPVTNVTWFGADEFAKWAGGALPTEAQWEYAARGGQKSKNTKFAGGENIDEIAWHNGNSGGKTHQVGTKNPNELGIYDMSGNAVEWVADRFSRYTSRDKTNPTGPEAGKIRVIRGGGYDSGETGLTVYVRFSHPEDRTEARTGFRVAFKK